MASGPSVDPIWSKLGGQTSSSHGASGVSCVSPLLDGSVCEMPGNSPGSGHSPWGGPVLETSAGRGGLSSGLVQLDSEKAQHPWLHPPHIHKMRTMAIPFGQIMP